MGIFEEFNSLLSKDNRVEDSYEPIRANYYTDTYHMVSS